MPGREPGAGDAEAPAGGRGGKPRPDELNARVIDAANEGSSRLSEQQERDVERTGNQTNARGGLRPI